MTCVRTHTRITTTVTDDSGNEFEVQSTPIDWSEALVSVVGNKAIVSYLAVDHYPEDPTKDWDGEGKILHYTDHGERSEFMSAQGLDQYGEPDLDLVDDADIRDAYIAHFVANMSVEECDVEYVRDEDAGDEDDFVFVRHCAEYDFDNNAGRNMVFDETCERLRLGRWQELREKGQVGNPYHVVLDIYEHGGVEYSISDTGMQCRWDTSRAAAIWVPDDCAKENIEACVQTKLEELGGEWPSDEARNEAVDDVLHKYVRGALENYNAFCNGDVYVVHHEEFSLDESQSDDWQFVDDEVYGGHYQLKYAEQTLKEEHDARVARWTSANEK